MFNPQCLVLCQASSTWFRNVCSKCWIRPWLIVSMSPNLEPWDIRPWLVLHWKGFHQSAPRRMRSADSTGITPSNSRRDNPFSSPMPDPTFIPILLSTFSLLVHLLIRPFLPNLSHCVLWNTCYKLSYLFGFFQQWFHHLFALKNTVSFHRITFPFVFSDCDSLLLCSMLWPHWGCQWGWREGKHSSCSSLLANHYLPFLTKTHYLRPLSFGSPTF